MIILHDVIEAINNNPICEGWLVGGVVERGWSNPTLTVKKNPFVGNVHFFGRKINLTVAKD